LTTAAILGQEFIMRSALVPLLALTIVSCSNSGGGSSGLGSNSLAVSPASTQTIASPGGLWTGVDSDSNPVTLLVNEEGFFFFLRGPLVKGTGVLTVTSSESLRGVMLLPNEFDTSQLVTRLDCNLTGQIEERASLTLDVRCRDSQLTGDLTTLSLAYDARYDRDSSLSTIAGNFYYYQIGSVLNIAGDGAVFSQNSKNCLTNGRITIMNSTYNVYRIDLQFTSCSGLGSSVNGDTYSGLALLDDSATPERLTFIVSNDRADRYATILGWVDRL
jgi:hypothetical protein